MDKYLSQNYSKVKGYLGYDEEILVNKMLEADDNEDYYEIHPELLALEENRN